MGTSTKRQSANIAEPSAERYQKHVVGFKPTPVVLDDDRMLANTERHPFASLEKAAVGLSDLQKGRQLRHSLMTFLTQLDTENPEGVRKECERLVGESLRLAWGVGTGAVSPKTNA